LPFLLKNQLFSVFKNVFPLDTNIRRDTKRYVNMHGKPILKILLDKEIIRKKEF